MSYLKPRILTAVGLCLSFLSFCHPAWSLSPDQESVIASAMRTGSVTHTPGEVALLITLFIAVGYLLWTGWLTLSSYSSWAVRKSSMGDFAYNVIVAIIIMTLIFWVIL